jgi:hypothetical protein
MPTLFRHLLSNVLQQLPTYDPNGDQLLVDVGKDLWMTDDGYASEILLGVMDAWTQMYLGQALTAVKPYRSVLTSTFTDTNGGGWITTIFRNGE